MMHGYGFGLWGMGFWGMLLFWIVTIVVIVWIVRSVLAQNDGQKNSSSSLQILEERYAKGEINKKEFLSMKATLNE